MAASQAKRLREKLVREGKMDPSMKRGSWYGVNPVERKPERPKIERLRKEKKHRGRLVRGSESDVSFFMVSFNRLRTQNDEVPDFKELLHFVQSRIKLVSSTISV